MNNGTDPRDLPLQKQAAIVIAFLAIIAAWLAVGFGLSFFFGIVITLLAVVIVHIAQRPDDDEDDVE